MTGMCLVSLSQARASDRISHFHSLQVRGAILAYCRKKGMTHSVTVLLSLWRRFAQVSAGKEMRGEDPFFRSNLLDNKLVRRYGKKRKTHAERLRTTKRRRQKYVAHLVRAQVCEARYGMVRATLPLLRPLYQSGKKGTCVLRSKVQNSALPTVKGDAHAIYRGVGRGCVAKEMERNPKGQFSGKKIQETKQKPAPVEGVSLGDAAVQRHVARYLAMVPAHLMTADKPANDSAEVAPVGAPANKVEEKPKARAAYIRPAARGRPAAMIVPDWPGGTCTEKDVATLNKMYGLRLHAKPFIDAQIGWNSALAACESMETKRDDGGFQSLEAIVFNAAKLRQQGVWGWVRKI